MNPSRNAPPPSTVEPHLLGSSLRRSTTDRLVLGVCGGVAEATGTNVTAVRLGTWAISVVLLPVALLGYVVTALIMPRADGATLIGPGRRDRRDVTIAVIASIVAAPIVLGAADGALISTSATFPVVFIGTLALGIALILRQQATLEHPPAADPAPPTTRETTPSFSKSSPATGDDPTVIGPQANAGADTGEPPTFVRTGASGGAPPPPGPPAPPTADPGPTPQRRGLALPVLSILTLIPAVFAVLVATGAIDGDFSAWAVMLALLAVASAAGAATIAILRPSYLGAGLLVALAASFGALSIGVNQFGPVVNDGVGERTYRPGATDELRRPYLLGAGELTLDLRDLNLAKGSRTKVDATLGYGHLRIVVPNGVRVAAAPTSEATGLTASPRRTGATEDQTASAPVIELDIDVRGAQIDLLIGNAIHMENLTTISSESTGFWGTDSATADELRRQAAADRRQEAQDRERLSP